MLRRKGLRSGYTTGACAAAAAKAAAMLLLVNMKKTGSEAEVPDSWVEVPFPDGGRRQFRIQNLRFKTEETKCLATASVIKDAGDDPDVTNGAEIRADVSIAPDHPELSNQGLGVRGSGLIIRGGKGVGRITKPGLAVAIGEAAINPVPVSMIRAAVKEALLKYEIRDPDLEVTISVPDGEKIAKKTLNSRLGIIGGISILGTTGIVRPVSSEAWTATITASMDVAKAMGCGEIVLSAGRTSEKAHIKKYKLAEEAYVMMGDYLEFSLIEAGRHLFEQIHLCAQWAKMLKIAMSVPQTHVRHGAIDITKAVELLRGMGYRPRPASDEFNTAREIFDSIGSGQPQLFSRLCSAAKRYAEGIVSGIPVVTHLVSYGGDIIADSE